jgi:hypothetical protein
VGEQDARGWLERGFRHRAVVRLAAVDVDGVLAKFFSSLSITWMANFI